MGGSTPYGHHADSLFRSCNRKYYYENRLYLGVPPSLPLIVGSLVHAGLAEFHKEPHHDRGNRALLATHDAITEFQGVADNDTINQGSFHAYKLMQAYITYYKEPDDFQVIDTEREFNVSYNDLSITGRWDGIIVRDGLTLVLEHKTTALEAATFIDHQRIGLQLTRYCHAASEFLKRPVNGALLNIIQKGRSLVSPPRFHRTIISRSTHDIETFLNELNTTRSHISMCDVSNVWPMNTDQCMQWGRKCEYMQLCEFGINSDTKALYTDNTPDAPQSLNTFIRKERGTRNDQRI